MGREGLKILLGAQGFQVEVCLVEQSIVRFLGKKDNETESHLGEPPSAQPVKVSEAVFEKSSEKTFGISKASEAASETTSGISKTSKVSEILVNDLVEVKVCRSDELHSDKLYNDNSHDDKSHSDKLQDGALRASEVNIHFRPQREFFVSRSMEVHKSFVQFQQKIKEFLRDCNLDEVQTPTLVESGGYDSNLHCFSTSCQWGQHKKLVQLCTSPELSLKKMISLGYSDIFELKTCFRNEEVTEEHEPEFILAEWYRGFSELTEIQKDLEELIAFLRHHFQERKQEDKEASESEDDQKDEQEGKQGREQENEQKDEEPLATVVTTVSKCFSKFLGFELQPHTTCQALRELCVQNQLDVHPSDDFDDLFHRLFVHKIESQFDPQKLTFIYDYPPSQCALARINSAGWSDRFELYWRKKELANAYGELTCPRELKDRLKKFDQPVDENFFRAMEFGLPPCSGVALGVDRLFMVMKNHRDIAELRPFSMGQELR